MKTKPKRTDRFKAKYRHYKTGKVMWAKKYGYKGWPF